MATLTIPNSITTNSNIEAAPLAENFATIASHANTELVNRDGTVAMTAELQLADGNSAASKVYADNAVALSIPPGVTLPYAGLVVPAGFLSADGTAVSRSTYAKLFAAVGVIYGAGNGTTTFNLPNLTGRFPVGYHGGLTAFNVVGKAGGNRDAIVVTHTHGHTIAATAGGTHSHTTFKDAFDMQAIAVGGLPTTGDPGWLFGNTAGISRLQNGSAAYAIHQTLINSAGSHSHGVSGGISAAGAGATDANLPPYLTMNFIIKT